MTEHPRPVLHALWYSQYVQSPHGKAKYHHTAVGVKHYGGWYLDLQWTGDIYCTARYHRFLKLEQNRLNVIQMTSSWHHRNLANQEKCFAKNNTCVSFFTVRKIGVIFYKHIYVWKSGWIQISNVNDVNEDKYSMYIKIRVPTGITWTSTWYVPERSHTVFELLTKIPDF